MSRPPRRSGARPSKSRRRAARREGPSQKGLKIGEAARLVGVKPFVLRFWETQFPFLKANHARFKHRLYGAQDIEDLRLVKRLLHQERFTIEGARKHLKDLGLEGVRATLTGAAPSRAAKTTPEGPNGPLRQILFEIRRELEGLHKLFKD